MTSVLRGKRIGLLTASAGSRGGGVSQVVADLAAMVRNSGGEPLVFALDDAERDAAEAKLAPTPLIRANIAGPAALGFAPNQLAQLIEARLDLLHLHGIWMHPSRVGAQWARATGRPYLISPHGMLEPWATTRGRWKKALSRAGWERASWARATAFHALTDNEAHDIARETGRTESVVIPNAGPPCGPEPAPGRLPEVLYLGRIHRKKNLVGLIAGWGLARLPHGARLHIAGWGEADDVADFQRMLAAAGDLSIVFHGPTFGDVKQGLLQTARFLILPSFSEGLPMVVLEAWAAATPSLMSEACNLPEGFAANAALACGTAPHEIADCLEAGLALGDSAWLEMAHAAQGLMASQFSATSVAHRWENAYSSLIASRPGVNTSHQTRSRIGAPL